MKSIYLVLLISFITGSSVAVAGKQEVCHFQEDNNAWKKLSLPDPAVSGHLTNHPEDGVPFDGTFTDECTTEICPGTTVAGIEGCWFLGELNQSCDDVCTSQGLSYSEKTKTVAGSEGSNENCFDVLDTLAAPAEIRCDGDTALSEGIQEVGGGGRGCMYVDKSTDSACITNPSFIDRYDWMRDVYSPTTSDAHQTISARACACQ